MWARCIANDPEAAAEYRCGRPLLRSLPGEALQTAEQVTPRVFAKALVSVRQNRYSVPVGLVELRVTATIGAREITIAHVAVSWSPTGDAIATAVSGGYQSKATTS
jgi:hypothetical protein